MTDVMPLKNLKAHIENMEKTHQIEILKILRDDNKVILNENKSGVFVNLTYCPENTIETIKKYIDYTKDQDDLLKTVEQEKNIVKSEFFNSSTTI
jgi:hypothetical protein